MHEQKGVNWGQVFSWKRVLIAVTILVFLSFLAFSFGFVKKTCVDETCFLHSLERCSSAKYVRLQNMNYYRYTIDGYSGDNCVIEIEIRKMAEGTPQEEGSL